MVPVTTRTPFHEHSNSTFDTNDDEKYLVVKMKFLY